MSPFSVIHELPTTIIYKFSWLDAILSYSLFIVAHNTEDGNNMERNGFDKRIICEILYFNFILIL